MSDATACELAEAREQLGDVPASELHAFAARQSAALFRVEEAARFYAEHDCRMARLHQLTTAYVALTRFPGFSAAFERIGSLLHPVAPDGRPRGPRWEAYARACRLQRALDVRDELWLAAHAADLLEVRRQHLERTFQDEAARHPGHPVWPLMRRHFEFTLGAQRRDDEARAGQIAFETAIADAIGRSVSRMLRDGGSTFLRAFILGTRALFSGRPARAGLPSRRRVALLTLAGAFRSLSTIGVWRRGLREATRGEAAPGAEWPILAQVLGEGVSDVHPLVVAFYNNPAQYDMSCTLELYTAPARFWSRLLTHVAGQGLYEAGSQTHDARIRTYRRQDGSMHFVREVDTGSALRAFDSDFVVREHRGKPTLFERFPDENIDYELVVTPLGAGRGVSIRGRDLYWRGRRLPSIGLEVEFQSEVEEGPEGPRLRLEGLLAMRPRTTLGRFLAYRVLQRPERLGCIRYVAVRREPRTDAGPWPFLS